MTQANSIDSAFNKWTSRRKTKSGYMIKCKKGLWRVDAPSKLKAEIEAKHYFAQYYLDGEYK